jgi:tetratricopeptide (TPR) repeat protein
MNKIMNRIDKIKEFLLTTPNDSFLQHALALEYIKEGNDEMAKSLFEKILGREPNYVGSYYHLGKLLERQNNIDAAIEVYKKGMQEAKMAKDNHSYNELMGACEDLEE